MIPTGERTATDLHQTRIIVLVGSGVVFAALVVGLVVFLLAGSRGKSFEIATHEWRREIPIETLTTLDESEWCNRMPSDATKVSRHRELRDTRQIRDGETCSNVRVEEGGRTTTRRECTERWRDEPIYDDRCSFTVNRWRTARTESASGPRSQEPRWPPVKLETAGQGPGAEREGPGKERYVVVVVDTKDAKTECDLDRAHWAGLPAAGRLDGSVAPLTGKLDCASLKAP